MKRISVIILLPLVMFALERVNLIKDHSFEKGSEVWHTRLAGSGFPNFVATVSGHDSEDSYTGGFSGSGDTRPEPRETWPGFIENAYITQGFTSEKFLSDIDSIIIRYSIRAFNKNVELTFMSPILLHINAKLEDYWKVGYVLKSPVVVAGKPEHFEYLESIVFPDDTFWHQLARDIYKDIEMWEITNIPLDATLDSLIFWIAGYNWDFPWEAQKVFFDDVRLMGYADYDVGIKAILSDDGGSPYTPEAHIKNFGREPADSFLVIAEISKESIVYADTLPWSLPSDTEDTVSFRTFTPPDTGTYTLRIYTFMNPDESDADDELSKELYFSAIAEPTTPVTHLELNVDPLTSGDVRVAYSLPNGHVGTLTLFDASGRRVDAKQVRGYGSVEFTSDLSAGVYIVKMEVGSVSLSRKVIVLR